MAFLAPTEFVVKRQSHSCVILQDLDNRRMLSCFCPSWAARLLTFDFRFTSEQHCNYNIEWRTSAACSLSAGTRFGTCGISTSSGEAFSLASIGDQGAVSVTGAPANQNYEIAICGANTRQCNRPGAAACVQDANTRQWYSLGGEGGLQSTSRCVGPLCMLN